MTKIVAKFRCGPIMVLERIANSSTGDEPVSGFKSPPHRQSFRILSAT